MMIFKFKPPLKKIRRLMMQAGVTNRMIAREKKVSEQWVSMILHGKGESRPLKAAIAKKLRVPTGEIFPSYAKEKAASAAKEAV